MDSFIVERSFSRLHGVSKDGVSKDGMSKDGRKMSPMHVALKAGVISQRTTSLVQL